MLTGGDTPHCINWLNTMTMNDNDNDDKGHRKLYHAVDPPPTTSY